MIRRSAREGRGFGAASLAALVAALGLGSGGCSFYWSKPPPPPSTWPNPVLPSTSESKCVSTIGPAVLDTVAAGTFLTIGFVERNAITYVNVPNVDATGAPVDEGGTSLSHFAPFSTTTNAVPDHVSRGLALTFGIGALVLAASSVYGYFSAVRCQRYRALFAQ
jgi:hypothetical protein